MAVNPESLSARSSVRVERIRGGEHVWAVTVVAGDDDAVALREAIVLARQIEKELTITFDWREDNTPSAYGRETPAT